MADSRVIDHCDFFGCRLIKILRHGAAAAATTIAPRGQAEAEAEDSRRREPTCCCDQCIRRSTAEHSWLVVGYLWMLRRLQQL